MNHNSKQDLFEQISAQKNQSEGLIATFTINLSNYSNVIQTCEQIIVSSLMNTYQKSQQGELEQASQQRNLFQMMTLVQQQQVDYFTPPQFCNQKQSFEDQGSLRSEIAYLQKQLKIQENIKYKILDYTGEIMKQNKNLQQEILELKQSITELKELNKNPDKKTCEKDTQTNQPNTVKPQQQFFRKKRITLTHYEKLNQNQHGTPKTVKSRLNKRQYKRQQFL